MNSIFNKSVITNLIAITIIVIAHQSPVYPELILSIGFFALSGAITNWLAIYMLFEKVPFLYGSGVIPNRFEEFKSSIKSLMMDQFFTTDNIKQFISAKDKSHEHLNLELLMDAVDYDKIFEGLVSSIMESSFGAMLQMMGGEEALVPLKEPFTEKMKISLADMVGSDRFKQVLAKGLDSEQIGDSILVKIETVIDKRLNELTPQLVKQMVQNIIRKHLGWLVVWGGVFGGAIGAVFSFL